MLKTEPDPLDRRLDRAALALRADDPAATARVVARALSSRASPARPIGLRLATGVLALTLAGAALWPRGEARGALGFDQVIAATARAPHSIARDLPRNGRAGWFTVWRDGTRYASEYRIPERGGIVSETRSDGVLELRASYWDATPKPPGYRYATLGKPQPAYRAEYDTLEGIRRTYMASGEVPPATREGDRLLYKIAPIWDREHPSTVVADARSGRILEIQRFDMRTVLDYDTPVPPEVFRLAPSRKGVVVLRQKEMDSGIRADIARGVGAWLDGDGTFWRVYQGSPERPPEVKGLKLTGRTIGKAYERNGVVAVGSTPNRVPPATVVIAGVSVPVRRIGMIYGTRSAFAAGRSEVR